MISSIVLIILNLMGKINAEESLGFLKPYFLTLVVEVIIYVLIVPKVMDKIDEWGDKND